jgi:hypothetical protein
MEPAHLAGLRRGVMFFLRWVVTETDVQSLNEVTSEHVLA